MTDTPQAAEPKTTTVKPGDRPHHCRTCRCLDDTTDSLTVYPPHELFYGRCPDCNEIRWETHIYTGHRGSPRRTRHCNCCTHPHDLDHGSHTIPTRGTRDGSES